MSEGKREYGGLRGEEWSSLVGVRNEGIVVNRAMLPTGDGRGMVFPQSEHSVDDMFAARLTSSRFACGLYSYSTHVRSLSLSLPISHRSPLLQFRELPSLYFLASFFSVRLLSSFSLYLRGGVHAGHRQEVDNSQLANTNRSTSGFKLLGTRWQRA